MIVGLFQRGAVVTNRRGGRGQVVTRLVGIGTLPC